MEWTTVIEGGIPVLGGLYAIALGNGVIGSRSLPTPQQEKRLKLLRVLGPLVVAFGIYTGWQAHRNAVHPPAAFIASNIAQRLTLPLKIDAVTQLTGVEGRENNIVYEYTISTPLASLGGQYVVQRKLEQQWYSAACKTQNFSKLDRSGYTVQIHYTFKDSPEDVLISIPSRLCGY